MPYNVVPSHVVSNRAIAMSVRPVGHVYVCGTVCFDDELLSLYIKMKLNEAKTRSNYFIDCAIISFCLKELMLHH